MNREQENQRKTAKVKKWRKIQNDTVELGGCSLRERGRERERKRERERERERE